jgi:hypothetical protein
MSRVKNPVEKKSLRARIVELQAQVASQSVTAAALTLDAHMEMLRDKADQRGQTSAGQKGCAGNSGAST